MDAQRFDDIAKSLIRRTSRRRTLGGLCGGALVALGLVLPRETWARSRTCRPACGECLTCKKGGCTRKGGKRRCKKGTCRPQATGTACRGAGICRGGTCVCPSGTTECSGACVNLDTDPRNCGTCGKRCQLNATCNAGACQCVGGACGADDATCCPEASPRGACRCTGATNPDTCETAGSTALCPLGTLPCDGPRCAACCPAGSTCDTSTGTCLQ